MKISRSKIGPDTEEGERDLAPIPNTDPPENWVFGLFYTLVNRNYIRFWCYREIGKYVQRNVKLKRLVLNVARNHE